LAAKAPASREGVGPHRDGLRGPAVYFGRPVACGRWGCRGVQAREPVCWAADGRRPPVQDVGVNHRRAHVLVAQEFLDCADVVPRLQEVCGKRVAKRMACRLLRETRLSDGGSHCLLHDEFVHMVTAMFAGTWELRSDARSMEVGAVARGLEWESQKTNGPSGERCPAEGRGSSRAPEELRRYLPAFRPRSRPPVRPPLAQLVSAEVGQPYRRSHGSVKRCE
jgi:hypothetical protein